MTRTLALAVALASACKSNHADTCKKYVEIALRCDALRPDDEAAARRLLDGMCEAAYSGDYDGATGQTKQTMKEMYAHIQAAADCEATATTCEDYERCETRAK